MTRLTDEALMLYADGQLDNAESQRIAGIAAHDAEVRARIEAFRLTGGNLAGLFEDYLKTPAPTVNIPDRRTPETGPDHMAGHSGAMPRRRLGTAQRYGQALPLLAASLALVCGIGLGWLLRSQNASQPRTLTDVVERRAGRLIAQGALKTVLDTAGSGRQVAGSAAEGPAITIRMTFQDEAGNYCREYELSTAAERQAGVACRTGSDWSIAFQALLPGPPRDAVRIAPAASSRATMDAVVGSLITGDPLSPESEAALLRRHWAP